MTTLPVISVYAYEYIYHSIKNIDIGNSFISWVISFTEDHYKIVA
jgi:hypothetical protein